MTAWILPSLVYIFFMGALGVTTKLALRHMGWQDVIVWTTIVYVVISGGMLLFGQARVVVGAGSVAAIASAVLASTALVAFYVALGRGDASIVVPFTSVYPLVTLVLSALVLSEHITPLRGAGAVVVIIGVAMLSAGS